MKKLSKGLAFTALSAVLALFAGCSAPHTHTFSEDWESDSEYHWHEATCGHEEVSGREAHTWTTAHDDTNHWEECVCGAKRGETEHVFGEWIGSEEGHYRQCECGQKTATEEHSYHRGLCTDCGYGTEEVPVFTAEMLSSLQGDSIAFEGSVVYTETSIGEDGPETPNVLNSDLTTEMTESTFYQSEEVHDTDIVYRRTLFKGQDGNPNMYVFHTLQNEYEAVRFGSDVNGDGQVEEYYEWSMFVNPFNALTADLFTATENDNEFELAASVRSEVCNVLTGWNDTIVSFLVTVEGGKVVSMHMETAVEDHTSLTYGDYTSHSAYDLTIVGRGEEVIPPAVPQPYPESAGHAALAAALEKLENTSFTVLHTDKTPPALGDFEDVVETIYYTSEAVYVNYPDEPHGYLQAEDGVIEFFNNDGVLEEFARYLDETIAEDYLPRFDFSPALFEDLGGGVYEAYTAEIAELIAPRLDPIEMSAIAATTLRIELGADGNVKKVVYDYSGGTVEMEFSDFGSTSTGLDFGPLLGEEPIPEGVPEEAFGTFKTEEGAEHPFTLVLTHSSLTVNGESVQFELSVDEEYGAVTLKFTYNGVAYECNFTESNPYQPRAYWFVSSDDYVFVMAYRTEG